jgi:nitric oxide reductase subunit C
VGVTTPSGGVIMRITAQQSLEGHPTMSKFKHTLLLLMVLGLLLAACGGGGAGAPPPAGESSAADLARGKSLFEGAVIGSNSAPGCRTCHALEAGVTLVGPSMAGIAARAAENVQDPDYTGSARTAEEFLRESIVKPGAFIEEGFPPGVMYQNYGQDMSAQELGDLVAFLLELK